jgi:DAACS family dicarboxylate/amino acid:cation (Na+ or H+) symporter
MQLYTKISLGLVAGAAVGAAVNVLGFADAPAWSDAILPVLNFAGGAFIRAITMIVIPLVVASLLIGVASLGDIRKLGRIGGKTIGYYLLTTAFAITIGLTLATAVKPGSRISPASRDQLAAEYGGEAASRVSVAAERPDIWETFLNMIPRNPVAAAAEGNMLPLIVFVLVFGAAVSLLIPARRDAILTFMHGINDASMIIIDWIMKLAPYAVFALIASVISRFGLEVLQSLAVYSGVVVFGLLLHAVGTYGMLVTLLAKLNPLVFFQRSARCR